VAETLPGRLKHAWNAFVNKDPTSADNVPAYTLGPSYGSSRPDRPRLRISNERTIISSIYARIAIDVAAVNIMHVRQDQNGRYIETIFSGLNNCLTLDANIDQTGRALMLDAVLTLFDEGVIAIVPVDTTSDPSISGSWEVQTLRVGHIVNWYPKHIRVRVYNENTGLKQEVTLLKSQVAIIENPLYVVMNEPNSTLQRLIRKLGLLDAVDEQSSSGKLDLIIQLPYVIKSEARKTQAKGRRDEIEMQLKDSKYGVAYTDGTEKITQLNRPVENNLLATITYLTNMLYGQLGLTEEIFNGKADEKAMLNYYNRTVEPLIAAITDEMKRKFLTKTARSQYQSIMYFRDPFKLVPVLNLAEIADKLSRNAILSSNEFRAILGFKPSTDPTADTLSNKNLNQPGATAPPADQSQVVDSSLLGPDPNATAGVSAN